MSGGNLHRPGCECGYCKAVRIAASNAAEQEKAFEQHEKRTEDDVVIQGPRS